MNLAHWHLVLNHFPIIGTIFSFLLLSTGFILKKSGLKQAGLGLFVLTGLLTIPAFLTGEGAEEVLKAAGIREKKFIDIHEELGEIAIWTCNITGLIVLITLILDVKQKVVAKYLGFLILAISLGNIVLLKNIGTSGGEIRHTEIRTNTSSGANNQ